MAKPEWGVKRSCLACSTRFYDLHKYPITCPSCNAVFDVETIFRPRRSRAVVEEPVVKPETPVASDDDDDDDDKTIQDTSDIENDDEELSVISKDFSDESS